jgi:hypothetical protein
VSQVDDRQSTHGWPQIIAWVLAAAAAVFVWRGIVWATDDMVAGHYGRAVLTLVSAAVWLAGAVGTIHNGRRMRYVAWGAWIVNAIMPLALLWTGENAVAHVSPWFHGGSTYFYLPTLGAIVAIALLAWSSPSRIAARNGG